MKKKIIIIISIIVVITILVTIFLIFNKKDENTKIANPIITYSSLKEASKDTGFTIEGTDDLLEDYNPTYSTIDKKTLEIRLINKKQVITIRKAKSEDDISGNYVNYKLVNDIEEDEKIITIKGINSNTYELAIWMENDYSYSIDLENGVSKKELLKLVEKIK